MGGQTLLWGKLRVNANANVAIDNSRAICALILETSPALKKAGYGPGINQTTSPDVDECTTATHACDVTTSTCYNTFGGYECTCKPGYVQDANNNKKCNGAFHLILSIPIVILVSC